jgi:quercetin dioxygenase-like cupin family protein
VVRFPFEEKCTETYRIRTFSSETDPDELVWHRDVEDRLIRIIEGEGWFFQRDEELPQPLGAGDVIVVCRGEWHRVISTKKSKLNNS